MNQGELQKWVSVIDELQDNVRDAPYSNPYAIKQFREIATAFRSDPRWTAYVGEKLGEVDRDMGNWFGGRKPRGYSRDSFAVRL